GFLELHSTATLLHRCRPRTREPVRPIPPRERQPLLLQVEHHRLGCRAVGESRGDAHRALVFNAAHGALTKAKLKTQSRKRRSWTIKVTMTNPHQTPKDADRYKVCSKPLVFYRVILSRR